MSDDERKDTIKNVKEKHVPEKDSNKGTQDTNVLETTGSEKKKVETTDNTDLEAIKTAERFHILAEGTTETAESDISEKDTEDVEWSPVARTESKLIPKRFSIGYIKSTPQWKAFQGLISPTKATEERAVAQQSSTGAIRKTEKWKTFERAIGLTRETEKTINIPSKKTERKKAVARVPSTIKEEETDYTKNDKEKTYEEIEAQKPPSDAPEETETTLAASKISKIKEVFVKIFDGAKTDTLKSPESPQIHVETDSVLAPIEEAIVLEEFIGPEDDTVDETKLIDKDLSLCFIRSTPPDVEEEVNYVGDPWRIKAGKVRTANILLMICLNLKVAPPDVVKTRPCAKLECWIDPSVGNPTEAIARVGDQLIKQYDDLQTEAINLGNQLCETAKCTKFLDPSKEYVQRVCITARRKADQERVLLHYNGHGVLRPTDLGEIFFFSNDGSQYMPVHIWDLIHWLLPPSFFVYDCSGAGIVIDNFIKTMLLYEDTYKNMSAEERTSPHSPDEIRDYVYHLAACSATQSLPTHPDLPADLFTSCLTTPIKIATQWHVAQNKTVPNVDSDLINQIPGELNNWKTMLGELNYIFVMIADAIAWSTLPIDLFQQLFRRDELVATLFRNFLLACRVMRSHGCTPQSFPALPVTYNHRLWDSWDHVLDKSLKQLPDIVNSKKPYKYSTFFEEQLTAFEVWLRCASSKRKLPDELSIILPLLTNEKYAMQALNLLAKFLDLGSWAVNSALSIGMFPHVLHLLKNGKREFQPALMLVWAKILAVDSTFQYDLVWLECHPYFQQVLQDDSFESDCHTQAAFVLASMVNKCDLGRRLGLRDSLIDTCSHKLRCGDAQLKKWLCICLAELWDDYDEARWSGTRSGAEQELYSLLRDPCPEVRAAAVYALGTYMHSVHILSEHADVINKRNALNLIKDVYRDMSYLVRKELVAALQWAVLTYQSTFVNIAAQENVLNISRSSSLTSSLERSSNSLLVQASSVESLKSMQSLTRSFSSLSVSSEERVRTPPTPPVDFMKLKIWMALCSLETDPHPEVAQMASVVTGHIRCEVKKQAENIEEQISGVAGASSRSTQLSKKSKIISLVTTQFVESAFELFTQPQMNKRKPEDDPHSQLHYERDWRLKRNAIVRREGQKQRDLALTCKAYSQLFTKKFAVSPRVVQLHPYEPQIAVAGEDTFEIWDWSGTLKQFKIASCKDKLSQKSCKSRITALEWINAHDVALLMTAFDDGSIKLWQSSASTPTLVSAWQTCSDLTTHDEANPTSNVLLTWEPWTQTVVTSSHPRVIRLWNAEQELHAYDIPTNNKHPVTCLNSTYAGVDHKYEPCEIPGAANDGLQQFINQKHGLIVAGFADGSISIFDRRCEPKESQVLRWYYHTSKVLAVQLQRDKVISGCFDGCANIYDIRNRLPHDPACCIPVESAASAVAIHRDADIFAWGSTQQYIGIFDVMGKNLNKIYFRGGLLGFRFGTVNCMTFHPHKVILAVGNADRMITLYSVKRSQV